MTRTIAALSTFMVLGFSTPAYAVTASDLAAGWIAFFDVTWSLPPEPTINEPAATVHVAGSYALGDSPMNWTITGDPFSPDGIPRYVKLPGLGPSDVFTLSFESAFNCRTTPPSPGCRPEDVGRSGYSQIDFRFSGSTPTDIKAGDYPVAQDGLCIYGVNGCRPATLIDGHQSIISTPERAILPRLVPKFVKLGLGLETGFIRTLQRTTTRLAAAILRAPHGDTEIFLPSVTVRVIESCAGIHTLGLLLIAAGLLVAVIGPARHPLVGLVIIVAAAAIAIEANALRVAATAIGFQQAGVMTNTAKDWIGLGTTSLALVQLVGVARVFSVSRR